MNQEIRNRVKTYVNFRLLHNARRTIHYALNGKIEIIVQKNYFRYGY